MYMPTKPSDSCVDLYFELRRYGKEYAVITVENMEKFNQHVKDKLTLDSIYEHGYVLGCVISTKETILKRRKD